jgi:hypothetical protein
MESRSVRMLRGLLWSEAPHIKMRSRPGGIPGKVIIYVMKTRSLTPRQATGNALAIPVQGAGIIRTYSITNIVGGEPFNLKSEDWTDDTSMAICLAESLIEREGFDPVDHLMG